MMSKLINKIQSLWSKEWLLKLISLGVAMMLWYYVGGEDIVEKNVLVPIEVINLPNNLVISNKHKRNVEVTVRGPRSQIIEMGKDQEARQIDLSKATPGTLVEPIENESVPVPRGLEVLRVQPSSIILSLDKLIEKEFPINPVTTGEVMPGFVLEDLTIRPESITINGPQTILSQVDVLKTTPINISGLSESIQLQIPLVLNEDLVDLIGETSVTADFTVDYDTVVKTIEDMPVIVVVQGYVQEMEPALVDVTLKIPTILDEKGMDYGDLITVTAVPEDRPPDSGRLKVQVVPSPDLTLPLEIVAIDPEYVTPVLPPPPENTSSQEDKKNGSRADTPEIN